jgi:phosphotransferase system  glucose/maltose/N-acetylglucosamine-specific IIC component
MKTNLANRFWNLCAADFLSPKDFLRHAVLIVVAFCVAHAFGLREYTSFLNGTAGSVELGNKLSAFLGLIYLLLYFATVLLVPILILGALLASLWLKHRQRRTLVK